MSERKRRDYMPKESPEDVPEASTSRDRSRSPIDRTAKPVTKAPKPSSSSSPPKRPRQEDSSFITRATSYMGGPIAFRPIQYITVNSSTYIEFFKAMRESIISALLPGQDITATGFISEDDFALVCRYLLKSRVDTIHYRVSGQRQNSRISVPTGLPVPKCIADIINIIGTVTLNNGAYLLCPEPEVTPPAAGDQLQTKVTAAMLSSFSSFVNTAHSRGLIRTQYISISNDGTSAWALGVYETGSQLLANGNCQAVSIYAAFPEFSLSDVIYAAVTQNRMSGQTPLCTQSLWKSDEVRGISGLRFDFATNA